VLSELDDKYGKFEYDRVDVRFDEKDRTKITAAADSYEKKGFFAESKIRSVSRLDGTKYILSDNEWILFRFSGTEPLLRIYSEAPTKQKVKKNLKAGMEVIK
jgi:phosphomannomutase